MPIYLVVLISTLSQIGFGGSRVAVSLYALELGANQLTVGVIVALYSLSPMFLSIVIGRYSDRVSPHLPMIWGSALMAVAHWRWRRGDCGSTSGRSVARGMGVSGVWGGFTSDWSSQS